ERCGDQYGLTVSSFWKALIAFEEQDWGMFENHINRCLCMIETGGYEDFLEHRTLFGPFDLQIIPPLLLEANQQEISNKYISYLLKKLGISDQKVHPGYTLYVQTLGSFQVWLGNRELRQEDWRRDKAKEFFQLLVTHRRNGLAREEIMSYLWPEQD